MIKFRIVLPGVLLAASLALTAYGATPIADSPAHLSARLSGSSEVPPVPGEAQGTVEATLDRQTLLLSWTVTHSGLSGLPTAGHFHGPAMPGANAGVAVPLVGSLTSPIKGSATLTAAQVAELTAGRWYLNLHTAANPNGEIRGQVNALP